MTYQHIEWGKTRHGTPSGFDRHQTLQETPCDPCKAGKAAYDARYAQREETKARKKILARARQMALEDLRRAHPQEYGNLLLAAQAEMGVAYNA